MRLTFRAIAIWSICCAAACVPSPEDICHAACNAEAACFQASLSDRNSCHKFCVYLHGPDSFDPTDKDFEAKCKNAGDLRRQQLSCVHSASCGASEFEFHRTLSQKCGVDWTSGPSGFAVSSSGDVITKGCIMDPYRPQP